jgi:hypothetical protein
MGFSSTVPSSDDWFGELDKLNEVLGAMDNETDTEHKPVRIAVLDTGIDQNDPYADAITDYKDFVDGNNSIKKDNTGHGTNSVKLIFKVFNNAEIYVARIFENRDEHPDTKDLAEKARTACPKALLF